jgi:hypothetical protein
LVLALVVSAAAARPPAPAPGLQPVAAFLPVGVTYRPPAGAAARRRVLEEMRRRRCTVVRLTEGRAPASRHA